MQKSRELEYSHLKMHKATVLWQKQASWICSVSMYYDEPKLLAVTGLEALSE